MRPSFSRCPLARPASSVAIFVAATAVCALPAGVTVADAVRLAWTRTLDFLR